MMMSEESILLWWLENPGPSPAECRQIELERQADIINLDRMWTSVPFPEVESLPEVWREAYKLLLIQKPSLMALVTPSNRRIQ
jgi:hypothetical protein